MAFIVLWVVGDGPYFDIVILAHGVFSKGNFIFWSNLIKCVISALTYDIFSNPEPPKFSSFN